ncbi:MAG: phage portal protein [Paenibacillaceae bacterium]|nr:phage portal protein [Paenibacillaceae bacterium]
MEEVQEQEEKKRIHNSVVIKTISEDRVAIMESKAVDEDEFHGLYEDGAVLEPLYNPEQLTRLSENSDILQQCIDAYKTNIVGFGVDFDYDIDVDKQNESIQSALDKEWTKYENFFKFCNFDESYTEIMKKVVDDRERIGWGTLEVIEDAVGRPAGLEHIPAHKVRLCKRERKAISVKTMVPNDNGELIEITIMKKFRKFVQIVDSRKVFFKEFGDPRTLNCKTGLHDEAAADEDKATSIIFFNIYCPYTPYGLPRYIGQLLNVQGNRKAEELNYTYFMDGRHMPMAIIVENGKLTDESIQNISNSKGDKARHKYLILEAEGAEKTVSIGDDDEKSKVNIRFEKLAEMLEKDGLFQDYCKNNRDKIRSAFRLHPIYTGESQDYTRATADTARQVTEEQVFQPEREDIAFKFNNTLKRVLEINQVSMKFVAPTISDKAEIATAIAPYVQAGAASPNMLIDALGDLLGKSFEPFEGEWADKPLQLLLKEMELEASQSNGYGSEEQINNGSVGQENDQNTIEKSESIESIVGILKGLQIAIEEALTDEA